MKLTLVGQSTVIIELESGMLMITDPWFESYSFLRAFPPAVGPGDIPRCDVMLVSHKHIDHLDRAALRLAEERGATVIGSQKVARAARKKGLRRVLEVKQGDTVEHQGVKIHATAAYHQFARDAVGFVVEGEKTLYFCGDTRAEQPLIDELKGHDIDVALVQIACSTYFGREDGMNVREAARLVKEVKPVLAIPIHYQVRGKVLDPRRFLELVPPPTGLVLEPGRPTEV